MDSTGFFCSSYGHRIVLLLVFTLFWFVCCHPQNRYILFLFFGIGSFLLNDCGGKNSNPAPTMSCLLLDAFSATQSNTRPGGSRKEFAGVTTVP